MWRKAKPWPLALCLLGTGAATERAAAADLSAADLAWIDKCIADRKFEQLIR
jgi:hypothetical protein